MSEDMSIKVTDPKSVWALKMRLLEIHYVRGLTFEGGGPYYSDYSVVLYISFYFMISEIIVGTDNSKCTRWAFYFLIYISFLCIYKNVKSGM